MKKNWIKIYNTYIKLDAIVSFEQEKREYPGDTETLLTVDMDGGTSYEFDDQTGFWYDTLCALLGVNPDKESSDT